MSVLGDRVEQAREALGLSQSELARRIGVTPQLISAIEAGGVQRTRHLFALAKALGKPPEWFAGNETIMLTERLTVSTAIVRGIVAAGLWQEDSRQVGDDTLVPSSPDRRYAKLPQIAFKVVGNSMNRLVTDGQYVICIDYLEYPTPLREGDVVVAERRRHGERERTVKRVKTNGRAIELWPESDDPAHQDVLKLDTFEDDTTVLVVGLVIGYYKPA